MPVDYSTSNAEGFKFDDGLGPLRRVIRPRSEAAKFKELPRPGERGRRSANRLHSGDYRWSSAEIKRLHLGTFVKLVPDLDRRNGVRTSENRWHSKSFAAS